MMRRTLGAMLLLLVAAIPALAQQEIDRRQNVEINRGFFRLGAGVALEMEGTTNDAFEFFLRIDPTVDVTWILPASAGSSGQQLQTDGATQQTLSWASAASSRDNKILEGVFSPQSALDAILKTKIYRFHYKPDAAQSTGDKVTQYVGPVAEEAPYAMHFNGTILNPINTFGYTAAAIQALQAEIDALKAQLAEKPAKPRRWYLFWRRE